MYNSTIKFPGNLMILFSGKGRNIAITRYNAAFTDLQPFIELQFCFFTLQFLSNL